MKTLKFPKHLAAGCSHRSAIFTLLAAASLVIPQAHAADATWIVDAAGDWTNSANWSGGTVPGSTNTTNNVDIATFGGAITGAVTNTIDANRNIGGITFDYDYLSGGNGYVLRNNILLSDGGVIQEISTVTPTAERITRFSNDVFIQGDGGSATIKNDAASVRVRMFLNGVRGTSTAGKTTTLYLDGSNTAPNTFGSSLNDGPNGGNLAIVKNGAGYWRLTGATSDYSGGTTLNAGRLQYSAGTNATSTVFGTGTLTINGGMLQNTETSGDAKEFTTIANDIVVGGNFQFSTRSNNTTIFSGTVDLTGATRQISVDGAANSKVILSGVISNGGLTKTGTQTLVLQGANIFAGSTTVSTGTLKLDAASGSALGGTASVTVGANGTLLLSRSHQVNDSATVTLSGGTIRREGGVSETFGNLNLTTASFLNYGTGDTGTLTFGTYTPSSLLTVSNFFEGNKLVFSSDLTSTINNAGLFSFDNAFTYDWDNGASTFTITAIPEPSACIAAAGLIGLMLWRPLRRRSLSRGKPMKDGGFGIG